MAHNVIRYRDVPLYLERYATIRAAMDDAMARGLTAGQFAEECMANQTLEGLLLLQDLEELTWFDQVRRRHYHSERNSWLGLVDAYQTDKLVDRLAELPFCQEKVMF